jgi:hypothetical protein
MLPKKAIYVIIFLSLLIYGGYVFGSEAEASTKKSSREPNLLLGFGLVGALSTVQAIKDTIAEFR